MTEHSELDAHSELEARSVPVQEESFSSAEHEQSKTPFRVSLTVPVIIGALLLATTIGGVSGGIVSGIFSPKSQEASLVSSRSNLPNRVINNPNEVSVASAVAEKGLAGVVQLLVSPETTGQGSAGTGSGVVISANGHIITNTHVVTGDGTISKPIIKVQLQDGKILDAKLIGTDPLSDLAVVKVDPDPSMVPLSFADSSRVNIGELAVAIGSPLRLAGSVTDGIVSSLYRSIAVRSSAAPDSVTDPSSTDTPSPFDNWNFDFPGGKTVPQQSAQKFIALPVIQTDASINPGNSGGALLNARGEVIGINVALANPTVSSSGNAGSVGVGFAVPAVYAKRVSQEIIAKGSASHGFLGVALTDPDLPVTKQTGAVMKKVTAQGPADAAGIKAGDLVISVEKDVIENAYDLTARVRMRAPGETVTFRVIRDGKKQNISVKLGEYKA